MHVYNSRLATRSPERGLVLVYVALLALVIIGFVGLAIDGAFVLSTSQQLQHAADAAALDAVRYVGTEVDTGFPEARAAAVAVALANSAAKAAVTLDPNVSNVESGDIVVGYWDAGGRSFTPTTDSPNAVRIHAVRTDGNAQGPLALFFGALFGKNLCDAGATSTAVLAPPMAPLVLILDPTGQGALRINGTNSLNVQAGKIHANSSNKCGISLVGTPTMLASLTSVVGGACYPDGSILGPVHEKADVIADPLANVLPTISSWNAFKSSLPQPAGPTGKISTSGTYDPGYYPKGLVAASTEVIHLNPGSYMIGTDAKLSGSANVSGTGVTLFFDKGVELDISGSEAGMQLTPPGTGDAFHGITLFMHRQTTGNSVCKIGGGGVFRLEGITYVPSGELVMAGTPGKELGAIIAFRASTAGTTGFLVTGKGVPPLSDEPPSAYLVE